MTDCVTGKRAAREIVLKGNQEQLTRRYHYQARGHDFVWLVEQVADLFNMGIDGVTRPGRYL